jgi:hypothetical protein
VYGVAVLSPRIILWTVVIVGVLLAAITVTVGVSAIVVAAFSASSCRMDLLESVSEVW